jgi:type 1 glutamine amidotransferase
MVRAAFLLVVTAALAIGAAPPAGPAPGAPARPIRVFYCTHSAGFRHECLPLTREIMIALGRDLDWLQVVATDEISAMTPAVLDETDVLMLYTSGTLPMSDAQKTALRSFLERGGGLVGVHSASDTFHEWDWFVELIGGEFDGHPWHETVGIVVDDAAHPATKHLAPRFEIHDEIYQFKRLNERRHTLMRLDTNSVTHDVKPTRAYPLAWTNSFGKGRIFYTALGHREEVWKDKRFVDHILGAVRWAAAR